MQIPDEHLHQMEQNGGNKTKYQLEVFLPPRVMALAATKKQLTKKKKNRQ